MASIQRKYKFPLCCFNYFRNNFVRHFSSIIDDLEITDFHKKIIKKRYLRFVSEYMDKSIWTGRFYHSFRFIITTFSILVPALLSIQKKVEDLATSDDIETIQFNNMIYWITWTLSLGVTLLNGIFQLYSLDQTFFKAALIQEKLRMEGWHYVTLSGKYAIYPSHQDAFKRFINSVEKLKLKYVKFMYMDDETKNKNKVNNKEIEYISSVDSQPKSRNNIEIEFNDDDSSLIKEKSILLKKPYKNSLEESIEMVGNPILKNNTKYLKSFSTVTRTTSAEEALKHQSDSSESDEDI